MTVPPREYELAARLLAVAVESDSQRGEPRAALHDAAWRYGAGLGQDRPAGECGAPAAAAVLREHGFEPCAGEAGLIRLRNCPFHQLAARHPEIVCGMNLALIEGVVAGLGATGMRPALDPGPGRCCVVITTDGPAAADDEDEPQPTGAP